MQSIQERDPRGATGFALLLGIGASLILFVVSALIGTYGMEREAMLAPVVWWCVAQPAVFIVAALFGAWFFPRYLARKTLAGQAALFLALAAVTVLAGGAMMGLWILIG